MKQIKLSSSDFLDLVRPMIAKIDDDLYAHDFGDGPLRAKIQSMACDSMAVEQWVERLEFRLEQARLAACDAWNLSLCDLVDDLESSLGAEQASAKTASSSAATKAKQK